MNYNKEQYPSDINKLIQKCEQTILKINEHLTCKKCVIIKDLYIGDTSQRCIDFLDKLQITCNTKLHEKVKNQNELQGLYVFGELDEENKIIPIYVGISRTVFRRLRQHVWGNKDNEATFAYLKAKTRLDHKDKRVKMDVNEFKLEQAKIKNYRLVVIPETKHYDLYFMEVYIAGRLKSYWNSFKTH